MGLWTENLKIDIPAIDAQHRELVDAVDRLVNASEGEIGGMLNFVRDYTLKHFTDEQRHHAANGYPDAERHKQIHNAFIAEVNKLEAEFKKDGATPMLKIKLKKTLMDWLISHITFEDKKYGTYLKKKQMTNA